MPTDSTRHEALLKFQEFVHQKAGGRLKVEIYPSGQLGKEAEMIEAVKMGTQEGYLGGVFDALTPKLNLYLMPFFFEKQADLARRTPKNSASRCSPSGTEVPVISPTMCVPSGPPRT